MIKGIGIDISSIRRIGALVARYDQDTLQLIFTSSELERCHQAPSPAQSFTICFAAKEAVSKALGTGFVSIDWNEIDVELQVDRVAIILHGKALKCAKYLGAVECLASWSTWEDQVLVLVALQ